MSNSCQNSVYQISARGAVSEMRNYQYIIHHWYFFYYKGEMASASDDENISATEPGKLSHFKINLKI